MEVLDVVYHINIDKNENFFNPFSEVQSNVDSMMMYESYFKHPINRAQLKMLGNNIIVSEEDETMQWTKKEVLARLCTLFNYRTRDNIVNRDILSNEAGIIINQMGCDQNMPKSSLFKRICNRWPIVESTFKNHKFKSPGSIQMIRIANQSKTPLFVCNIFSKPVDTMFSSYRSIKRALMRVRAESKNKNLPVYADIDIANSINCDKEKYLNLLKHTIPTITFCRSTVVCE